MLAIERHSGVRPVELHKIRRQDPALGKDADERTRIKDYRNAVESAAAGKLSDQKVREAEPGAKGKPAGILKSSVLVEVGGRFITVSNKMLGHVTVYLPREISVAQGDRIHLKANRKLASGGRVTNGELVTAKSVRPDGAVELTDGRVLDKSFREFLPGYAVTSYGSQGKTV